MKTRLIYLGTRGGGAEIFHELRSVAKKWEDDNAIEFIRSDSYALKDDLDRDQSRDHVLPSLKSILKKPWLCAKFVITLIKIFNTSSPTVNIFLMPSPLDLFVFKASKRKRDKNIFLIHDAEPHPGEFWPRRFSIKWRIQKGDATIVLSDFILNRIRGIKHEGIKKVMSHPTFNSLIQPSNFDQFEFLGETQKPTLLFLGRVKKYKGLEVLVKNKKYIQERFCLVIAGFGSLPDGLEDSIIVNKWLTDAEMSSLLSDANVLVFPYSEASQSGIIPAAIALNKILIVSNVGGLAEQVYNYPQAHRFDFSNPQSFINALEEAHKDFSSQRSTQVHGIGPKNLAFPEFLSELMAFSTEVMNQKC